MNKSTALIASGGGLELVASSVDWRMALETLLDTLNSPRTRKATQ